MTNFLQKLFSGFSPSKEETPEISERLNEYEQIFKLAKKKNLTDEKKAELEALYVQLIKKSDNATSGQLQFLGLDQIKQKMGPKWPRLQSKVYATAEDVILRNITSSDIHFLYKEDRYVIIFTQSTDEEINTKVSKISDEIMRRLAELDEEELKALQIKQEIKKIDAETFLESEFPDMLDFVFKQYNPVSRGSDDNADYIAEQKVFVDKESLEYHYLPLWDVNKKAFSSHLCIAISQSGWDMPIFDAYKLLFQKKSLAERTAIDIAMLEKVIDELEQMEISGRKDTLICPVQHETVYNFSSYDEYKYVCQTIPNSQRDSIVFMVTNSENFSLPAKDPYWFIPLMKEYCGGVIVDVLMRDPMSFQSLKGCGAIGLSIQIASILPDEEKNLNLLLGFNAQAKYFRMKKTSVMNISTAEEAKRLARMGFNLLGGPIFSPLTATPDAIIDPVHQRTLLELFK